MSTQIIEERFIFVKAPALTLGMACFDDFDGVYFSVQALRMYQDMTDTEILVVDNAGDPAVERFIKGLPGGNVRYVLYKDSVGTSSSRNKVFEEARGVAVACLDCHVLLVPGAVAKLKEYYTENPDTHDLIQGPLLYDDLQNIAVAFDKTWSSHMMGQWQSDSRGNGTEPFEIVSQGLGFFSCLKRHWLGFSKFTKSFGGEEFYIHEKFRQAGAKALCIPQIKWLHRFYRKVIPYPNILEDRAYNYMVEWLELGLDTAPIIEHFANTAPKMSLEKLNRIKAEAEAVLKVNKTITIASVPKPEPVQVIQPRTIKNSDHLVAGLYYSHNTPPLGILQASLNSIKAAQEASNINVVIRTCTNEAIPGNPFQNYMNKLIIQNHLGMVIQVLRMLYELDKEGIKPHAVLCLEHDVLYPEDYFDRQFQALTASGGFAAIDHNYIGMNHTGFLKKTVKATPLHQVILTHDYAITHFETKQKEVILRGEACLDPDNNKTLYQYESNTTKPCVHLNHNRPFTSYFKYFEKTSNQTDHPYWGPFTKYYPPNQKALAW